MSVLLVGLVPSSVIADGLDDDHDHSCCSEFERGFDTTVEFGDIIEPDRSNPCCDRMVKKTIYPDVSHAIYLAGKYCNVTIYKLTYCTTCGAVWVYTYDRNEIWTNPHGHW